MTQPEPEESSIFDAINSMEIAIGGLAILMLGLAYQIEPELFLHTFCTTAFNMIDKNPFADEDSEEAAAQETTIDMGDIAADTLDDIPRFLILVSDITRESGKERCGVIHVLSLHARLKFEVSPDRPPSEGEECFEDIWRNVEDVRDIDMQDIPMKDKSQLACDSQNGTTRLSLKYIGTSPAAVVLPD